jgi:hypothetical protein
MSNKKSVLGSYHSYVSFAASTTFGCEENVNKERAYSTSSVFKKTINKYSNHWQLSVTLSTIDQ